MLSNPANTCPCGSGSEFTHCCGKFINGESLPENPEQLMRSRYSANVLKNETYLLGSWHKSTRPESLDLTSDSLQWMKLKVISTHENKVSFVAYFTQDALTKEKMCALTEESNFVKEGRWFYVDGQDVKTIQLTKNMLCPCLSGKKFKRCCEPELQ